MSIYAKYRGAAMVLAFTTAFCLASVHAQEVDDFRVGDGSGSVMTLDDLDEVTPHLERSRSSRPAPGALVAATVEPGAYYYYDDAGNLMHYLDGRHTVVERVIPYDGDDYVPTLSSDQLRVYPGPGQIVALSEHDYWPIHDGGDTGYWDKGYTITGDPAYMSYYERNFGWGRGMNHYAGPRFDRGHIPSHPAPRVRGTGFQEQYPGRLPARRNSPDPMERREARREFYRDGGRGAETGTPGIPRPRPSRNEGRRPGR